MEKKKDQTEEKNLQGDTQQEVDARYDGLKKEAEEEKGVKKPGSQSNHSDQHNNGRGGGK